MAEQELKSFMIPAPTGGLNARDPISAMAPNDALIMDNIIPDGKSVRVRKGLGVLTSYSQDSYANSIHGLMDFTPASGNERLIVTYNKNGDANLTVGSITFTDYGLIKSNATIGTIPIGQTTRPRGLMFRNRLFIHVYGNSTVGCVTDGDTPVLTNVLAVTGDTYATIGSYRSRLYLASKTSPGLWYGNVDQVAGAMPSANFYPMDGLLQKGGNVIYANAANSQNGSISQECLCVASDQGEILIFTGSYPGSTSWSLSARYFTSKPAGQNAFFNLGASLFIITQNGIFSLDEITSNYQVTGTFATLTDKIRANFPSYTSEALASGVSTEVRDGTCAIVDEAENKLLIHFPSDDSTVLCMDLTSKAVGKLIYPGLGFTAVGKCKDRIYFGLGPQILKYQCEEACDVIINTDTGLLQDINFHWKLRTAHNYLDSQNVKKIFSGVKAIIEGGVPSGISVYAQTDFDVAEPSGVNYSLTQNSLEVTSSQPEWALGNNLNVGECISITIEGESNKAFYAVTSNTGTEHFTLNGIKVFYTEGGNW